MKASSHFSVYAGILYAMLFTLPLITAASTDPETLILNTVYGHWGSPVQLASWGASSGQIACNMTGITCNAQAKVVSLSLYNIPTGIFDPLLFSLTSLTSIALVLVQLVGSVPAQISRLTGLQMLQTSSNLLAGSLPPSLSLLLSLAVLQMNANQLTGSIPPQLSTLTLLSQIQLSNNKVSGRLPLSLSALNALVNFYMPFNSLSGPIPAQYSTLQQLTMLFLSSNSLTSTIPAQLTSIGNLSVNVNYNQAMCGPPLTYGPQANTNIGQDCPDPNKVNPWTIVVEVFFSLSGFCAAMAGTFMLIRAVIIQREAARLEALRLARRAPVVVVVQPPPEMQIQIQPVAQPQQLQQPPVASRAELTRFFLPE